jgi:hypothetical protein
VAAYTFRRRYLFVVASLAIGQESYAVQREEETKATKEAKALRATKVVIAGKI